MTGDYLKRGMVLLLCFISTWNAGCSRKSPCAFIDGLKSYSSLNETRSVISRSRDVNTWTETHREFESRKTGKRDRTVTLTGPYKSLGFAGTLTLSFFNDQLARADFGVSASNGKAYADAFQRSSGIALRVGQAVKSNDGATLVCLLRDDSYHFIWDDARLIDEWTKATDQNYIGAGGLHNDTR